MMGALYQTTGDSLHAGLAHNRAVARAESAGLAIVQALAIQGRALYYYDTKRYTEAEAEYAEAHRLFQTILTEHTDRFGLPIPNEPYVFSLNNAVTAKILLARNLNGTANLLHAEGQYTEAFKLHAQSLKIFESLQSIQGQARCLHDMGRVLMEERKYAQALAHFALALQMREDINAHDGRMTTLMEMAELYRRQNDYDKAMLFLRQALQLAGSTRNLPKEIRAHQALSNCYQHKRQIDMVEFHKAQAEELQRQIEREAESAISAHRTDFIELGLE
jgi:tetratricopeptide (TPR) repeat protein